MNRLKLITAGLLILGALFVGDMVLRGTAQEQGKDKPAAAGARWEYKVLVFSGVKGKKGAPAAVFGGQQPRLPLDQMEQELNHLGKDGWECVAATSFDGSPSMSPFASGVHLILKRPLQ